MQILNKSGIIHVWQIVIHAAVIRTAFNFNISLMFYGEDEKSSMVEIQRISIYEIDYMKSIYLEGGYGKVLDKAIANDILIDKDCYFFRFLQEKGVEEKQLTFTHWFYYENRDLRRNYEIVRDYCGLQENKEKNLQTLLRITRHCIPYMHT